MNNPIVSDKESIIAALNRAVDQVNDHVKAMNKATFEYAPAGKWNAGQHLDHLIRSIKPLNLAYALPVFILKLRFGMANRPSKTYDGLVEKYKTKLAGGGRATGRFIPPPVGYEAREKLYEDYKRQKENLVKKIRSFKEPHLDKYILPHPLLGKLTLREMLFFTIHHNVHHLNLIIKYAGTDLS